MGRILPTQAQGRDGSPDTGWAAVDPVPQDLPRFACVARACRAPLGHASWTGRYGAQAQHMCSGASPVLAAHRRRRPMRLESPADARVRRGAPYPIRATAGRASRVGVQKGETGPNQSSPPRLGRSHPNGRNRLEFMSYAAGRPGFVPLCAGASKSPGAILEEADRSRDQGEDLRPRPRLPRLLLANDGRGLVNEAPAKERTAERRAAEAARPAGVEGVPHHAGEGGRLHRRWVGHPDEKVMPPRDVAASTFCASSLLARRFARAGRGRHGPRVHPA